MHAQVLERLNAQFDLLVADDAPGILSEVLRTLNAILPHVKGSFRENCTGYCATRAFGLQLADRAAQSCYRRFYASRRSQRTPSPRTWPFYSSIACTLPTRLISSSPFQFVLISRA